MRGIFQQGRKALMALAVAVGIIVPAAPSVAGWQPNDDDALLFDVRVGQYRIGNGIRGYQTDKGICVDLADTIMTFDLPVRLDKKSRRATGWLFEESRTFTLDRELNAVQIVNKSAPLAEGEIVDTPEGWCVEVATLGRWLDVGLKADMSGAILVVEADRKLPFELAEERKARAGKAKPATRFDLATLPQAKDPYRFWRTPSIDVVASAGFSDNKNAKATFDGRYEIYASGELAGASFDARLASDNRGIPSSLRLRAYRSSPNGGLLGPLDATHFAVGDVSTGSTSLGMQSTAGRGAYVTNRPLERADSFDKTSFRGELPDGWDAELYHNDQLISYAQSRGDGRYEFLDVSLYYGQNRFEVVLYGPQGQIRRDVRMVPVGLDSIPPRETYYWAAIQDAGRDLINFNDVDTRDHAGLRAGFGLERGLNAKTSVGLSFVSGLFRGRRENVVEASLRRAIGPALIELAAANNIGSGFAWRGQMLGQFGKTLVSAETAWLRGGFRSERYDIGISSEHALAVDHSFKFGRTSLPIRAEARYTTRTDGSTKLRVASRTSFNISALNVSAELAWQRDQMPKLFDPAESFEGVLRLSGRLGGIRLRGEAIFELIGDSGFRESKITGEWGAGDDANWRAEIGYSKRDDRARFGVGYSRRFKHFAVTGQVEGASDGSVAAGINLAFSLGPDPRNGGIRVASEKLASQGQAMAVVYYDENGDGKRQSDEKLQKDVELTAGLTARGDPTDAKGQTLIDGLQPFQSVLIGIDASSLPDPFVQPATSGVVVTPRPGVATIIELPLVAAGEVSGTLQRAGGRALTGVDIELLDKGGRVVKTARTEYDGFFLFEFVPYGSYKLRVKALSANVVGVQQEISKPATLGKATPIADLGIVIVEPAQRIAEAKQAQGP